MSQHIVLFGTCRRGVRSIGVGVRKLDPSIGWTTRRKLLSMLLTITRSTRELDSARLKRSLREVCGLACGAEPNRPNGRKNRRWRRAIISHRGVHSCQVIHVSANIAYMTGGFWWCINLLGHIITPPWISFDTCPGATAWHSFCLARQIIRVCPVALWLHELCQVRDGEGTIESESLDWKMWFVLV